ncbi:unnamed protein product [Ectocarpus sp. 13 AM-2016]
MSRNESPFDMQIKLLMIGDSGESSCLLLLYALLRRVERNLRRV